MYKMNNINCIRRRPIYVDITNRATELYIILYLWKNVLHYIHDDDHSRTRRLPSLIVQEMANVFPIDFLHTLCTLYRGRLYRK